MGNLPDDLDGDSVRRLRDTLVQLDAQLCALNGALNGLSEHSPLATLRANVTELQQRMLSREVRRLREVMGDMLHRHGIAAPQPSGGVSQACRDALDRALAVVDALRPRLSPGGSPLSDEAAAELRRSVARLLQPLDDMQSALALYETFPCTEATTTDELSRIALAHGLSELAAPLASLARYEAGPDLVAAVLGSANAGKSSLVNRLLQTDLLPVDIIPSTVTPVSIRYGPHPRGTAYSAHRAPDTFMSDRLAEFTSERYNPGNIRRVENLVFEFPSPRLAEGVCMVDSPAWSPGDEPPLCDVGLVLVDATGSLALQEAALIDALRARGSEVVVLLSKAERLGDRDQWEVLRYVGERLRLDAGSWPPVFLASSAVAPEQPLWADWVLRGLDPCIARRDTLRQSSLQCKRRQMREAVSRRLKHLAATSACQMNERVGLARRKGTDLIKAAWRRSAMPGEEARTQALRAIREVIYNAAQMGVHGDEPTLRLGSMVEASLRARATSEQQDIERELALLATQCGDLLAHAVGGPAFAWHLDTSAAPSFDFHEMPGTLDVHRPRFGGLGAWLMRWYLQRALRRRHLACALEAMLRAHFVALDHWRHTELAEFSRAFTDSCVLHDGESMRIAADLARLQEDLPETMPSPSYTSH